MNYYSYLTSGDENKGLEAVAEDAKVSGLKSSLEESFPTRLRSVKSLLESVPRDLARKIIEANVDLIKTIPEEENHRKIAKYVIRVFDGKSSREDLVAYIMRLGGVEEERAALIADDQINKAAERFLVEKWKSKGCKRVRWVHSGGSNPRKYHMRKWNGKSGKRNGRPNGLNGYEFDIDKPPVINKKTNERGYPGQMINCHCSLIPIWDK